MSLRANYFVDSDIPQCQEWLHKIENFLAHRRDVDPFVFSTFYRFCMNFYTAKRKQKLFYSNALQYLAYTSGSEIEETEKLNMLTRMAFAVLASS